MNLYEMAEGVDNREALAEFISHLQWDFKTAGDDWENRDLGFYLNAMSRWVGSLPSLYKNLGEDLPEQPTWSLVADMLLVAKDYE